MLILVKTNKILNLRLPDFSRIEKVTHNWAWTYSRPMTKAISYFLKTIKMEGLFHSSRLIAACVNRRWGKIWPVNQSCPNLLRHDHKRVPNPYRDKGKLLATFSGPQAFLVITCLERLSFMLEESSTASMIWYCLLLGFVLLSQILSLRNWLAM